MCDFDELLKVVDIWLRVVEPFASDVLEQGVVLAVVNLCEIHLVRIASGFRLSHSIVIIFCGFSFCNRLRNIAIAGEEDVAMFLGVEDRFCLATASVMVS